MKALLLKLTMALLLVLSSLSPIALAKRYWYDYQVFGTDTIDQYAMCMMLATALLVSGIWVFVIAIITHKEED